MFTTVDVHFNLEDTIVEPTHERNGVTLHDPGSHDPRINIFFGSTNDEIVTNVEALELVLAEIRRQAAGR